MPASPARPLPTPPQEPLQDPSRFEGPHAADRFQHDLMEAAIALIEAQAAEHPSLEALAARMGISPAHFQKMFTRWVGVSPKRYLQWLTLDHARALLRDRHTVLDATYETGLSSPGRLHDLFVRWEAMTPGDYARGAEGLEIRYGWFEGPFGDTLAMGTDRGLCGLAFATEVGRRVTFEDTSARWPMAGFREDPDALAPWVEAAFRVRGGFGADPAGPAGTPEGAAPLPAPPLHVIGAPFQLKVWEALLAVPTGHVTTYGDVARAIGSPRAVRAVGTAVGRNPLSWLIPCHRVLRKGGALGGYHWGLGVKRAMLAWESVETARAEEDAA